MTKFPKPCFRNGRGWYVQVGKQQIKLGDGPENSDTEAAALKRYHQVMAENGRDNSAAPTTNDGLTVAEVYEKYLDWCLKHRSARSYEWYQKHIQLFLDVLINPGEMPAASLRPFHVVEHIDKHPTWGPNQRRGGIVCD